MNITTNGPIIHVTLSKRNLEHLLKAHELNVGVPTLKRVTEDGTNLYVTVEADAEHYQDRDADPGFDHALQRKAA